MLDTLCVGVSMSKSGLCVCMCVCVSNRVFLRLHMFVCIHLCVNL